MTADSVRGAGSGAHVTDGGVVSVEPPQGLVTLARWHIDNYGACCLRESFVVALLIAGDKDRHLAGEAWDRAWAESNAALESADV